MGKTISNPGPGPRAENSPCIYNTPKVRGWKQGQSLILRSGQDSVEVACLLVAGTDQLWLQDPHPCRSPDKAAGSQAGEWWEQGCGDTEGLRSSPGGHLLGAAELPRAFGPLYKKRKWLVF